MNAGNACKTSSPACARLAVLSKLNNDLRWMDSGPLAGIAEIQLEVAVEETGLSRAGLEGFLDPTRIAGIWSQSCCRVLAIAPPNAIIYPSRKVS
jgi:fumarate hydratase class II